jgi:hypothetical protein
MSSHVTEVGPMHFVGSVGLLGDEGLAAVADSLR